MTRKFKALGLALGAMAALVAFGAPAAQAETGALTTVGFPAIITGQQAPGVTFDIGVGPLRTVACATSDLETTFGAGPAADPVTFNPRYENCTSEPGGMTPVTVTMNGCDYTIGFGRPGTTGQQQGTGTMHAWVQCPAGQQIEIHVYANLFAHAANMSTCTYDIGAQGQVPAGIYHNTAHAGMIPDVKATINATFTATSTIGVGGAVCGGNPMNQGHLPITLTGEYTMRSFVDAGGNEGGQWPLHVG
ncbi:MAG TPA: hypothetical protein VN732_08105 [Solirubrobacterales bacterium]|nr:hypothetical protein [Solirubrobacterales bacterium]